MNSYQTAFPEVVTALADMVATGALRIGTKKTLQNERTSTALIHAAAF